MEGLSQLDKSLFPINDMKSVVQLFRNQLQDTQEPDITLLSIVAGAFENMLTCRPNPTSQCDSVNLPILELHTIEQLYAKFETLMHSAVEPRKGKTYATREIIKKVLDVIWNSLSRSYHKDRAHLQSLYSFLSGNKLDCFGLALAVVAGCQVLGYTDVHLALSEDHAWVMFGERGDQSAEVTWHGKGNEDKRGQDIGKGISARSWLYVNGHPVVCTRHMEVAALVSSINPSLNATHDACEVADLQQELLWLLYDLGHLKRYPMAIGNLGDLEEIEPMKGRIPCTALFQEAITSARTYYNNQHVYPYTYQGGYFYRNKMYKEAFESWANASDVIRPYNYSRDDEEIYKEFSEIANELIPHIMKVESSGFSANTILKKPECFANLLRFYDGICQWEEGSATPVLHFGWARPLVNTISKFDADVRAQVEIICARPEDDLVKRSNGYNLHHNNNNNNNNYEKAANGGGAANSGGESDLILSALKDQGGSSNFHPSIEALTAACSEKILNPEYLLQGDGSPFVGGEEAKAKVEEKENLVAEKTEILSENNSKTIEDEKKVEIIDKKNDEAQLEAVKADEEKKEEAAEEAMEEEARNKRPTIILHSQKMKQLKDLLLAEKLNTHAISLHLTAQSQVQIGKRGRIDDHSSSASSSGGSGADGSGTGGNGVRPKRSRRE